MPELPGRAKQIRGVSHLADIGPTQRNPAALAASLCHAAVVQLGGTSKMSWCWNCFIRLFEAGSQSRFPAGPTAPQSDGWQEIAAGRHTLIAAPTGSGKTLAAFLVCIDRIYRAHEASSQALGAGSQDTGTGAQARGPGSASPGQAPGARPGPRSCTCRRSRPWPSTSVRTSKRRWRRSRARRPPAWAWLPRRCGSRCAPATRRAPSGPRCCKHPPDFLVTTPGVAVPPGDGRAEPRDAGTGRHGDRGRDPRRRGQQAGLPPGADPGAAGAPVRAQPVQRIGLSATQRPIETVARLLVGAGPDRSAPDGSPRARSSIPATAVSSTWPSSCPTTSSRPSRRASRWTRSLTASPAT